MAVLFSAVTLTADNNQVEFLAAGIPRDSDDLEGWTAYRMTGARRLKPSTPRLLKWGIILNGACITADISESPSSDGACITAPA